jgi:hypothetical protein
VVIHGLAHEVTGVAAKQAALAAFVDAVIPGRSAAVRGPSQKETAATTVLRLDLEQVSLKVRSGPPGDDVEDLDLPYWAGVLPLALNSRTPEPSPDLLPSIATPSHVSDWTRG